MVTICYMIIYILESFILLQYCNNLFQTTRPGKVKYLVLFACYSILFCISLYENFWINFFMFLALNFICIFCIYDLKWLTAFFHAFLITIIMVLSELVIFSVLSYFAPDFYDNRTYFRNVIILSVPSKLLYFLILQCISQYIKRKKTRELSSDINTLFLNVIPLISGFISLIFATICMDTQLSLFLDIMITISVVSLLAINIFLAWFHTFIQEKNQKFMEMQILLQKEYDTAKYFDALYKQDEKQKILIHDIRKHLRSIAELNEKNEPEKITAYINQIVQSSDLQDSVRVCDNNLLNIMIYWIKQQCRKNDISLFTDIRAGCVNFLSEYDITALFSNLLDNALDATRNIPNSYIELSVTPHSERDFIITMVNSCEKDPFVGKAHRLVSSKKNPWRHGYGMKSIQRVIEKYDGNYKLYYDPKSSTFHTIIILRQK